jgi:HSP20 family protein
MRFDLPSLRSVFQPSRKTRANIDDIFDDFFSGPEHQLPYSLLSRKVQDFYPQLDVSETNDYYRLDLDLAGVDKKNIDIKIDNNVLTIKGKKDLDKEHQDSNFYTRERFHGDFQRSLSLPAGVDTDSVDADFKDGVLRIKLPKTGVPSSKTITINS